MIIVIEKYIIIYLLVTLLFSFIVSLFLQSRFPHKDENKQLIDQQELQLLDQKPIHKLLARITVHKYNRITAMVWIFFFNIAIPFAGYVFTLWIFWYLTHVKYENKVAFTNILDLDEFKNTFSKIDRVFGEGSMINLLNNPYVPKSKKLRALATLAATPSPSSLTIIKQTLSSNDDEIRLYGYSILNNLEKKINVKINVNLEKIHEEAGKKKDKQDEEIIADSSMNLAFSYWELVYLELAHESLKNNFLNSAINYIKIAKEFYKDEIKEYSKGIETLKLNKEDTEDFRKQLHTQTDALNDLYEKAAHLYTLMGRIFLYRGLHEQAQAELTIAEELLPEDTTTIIPYLAEVYFSIQKYSITQSVLNRYDSLKFNATLYPVIKQWEYKNA